MITLKNFQIYKSTLHSGSSVLFLKDESGLDWYESQAGFSEETLKFVYDSNGIIISFDYDVSKLWPVGHSVAEISASEVPAGLDISGGWVFDGKVITTRVYSSAEYVSQAEAERESSMALAAAAIAPLQDAVDIGDATDEERASLQGWKKYRVALNRLDLTAAPDIEWPEIPA
jgi:hypothetical protein